MLTVLSVCTGNICRSPLAEGFLADRSHRLLGGAVRARSAGTWARAGEPPTPESVTMAAERGVDISRHRSRPLTPEAVREADLIVGMTDEHVEEVVRLVPDAEPTTFTLRELVAIVQAMPPVNAHPVEDRIAAAHTGRSPEHVGDVRDPYGQGEDVYRDVAREIEAAVDGLITGLFGAAERAEAAGA